MFDWFLDLVSRGLSVKELARRLGVSPQDLKSVSLNYCEFKIPKKSGRFRLISSPNDELKSLQRQILRRLLSKLAVHPQATGFRKGISFVDNARCHQCQAIVIRIDLVNFFPSISRERVQQYFRQIGWNRSASRLLADLTTYQNQLPQGAPTSPLISNLVNRRLDTRLANLAESMSAIYTRYADDLTFSFSDPDAKVTDLIRTAFRIIRVEGYRPYVKKKFDVRRSHHCQVVTGLVVNEKVNLPRHKRRWLRAVMHRAQLEQQGGYVGPGPTLNREQIAGWQALLDLIHRSQNSE